MSMPLSCTATTSKLTQRKDSSQKMAARGSHIVKCSSSAVQTVRHQVATKTRSAKEVTQQYLQNISATEGKISSFITVDQDHALLQVRSTDFAMCRPGQLAEGGTHAL